LSERLSSVLGTGGFVDTYPPLSNLWNQRLDGKLLNNLWPAITYGQNLDSKELGLR